jgi:hypothetical protein
VTTFQVLEVDHSSHEIKLAYLKKLSEGLFSSTEETSWESMSVVKKALKEPSIDIAMSRRKIVYKF